MLLDITLLIATLSILAILALVFFAARLRSLLKKHLYHRAFTFFAVLAAAGILFAGVLGFRSGGQSGSAALAVNITAAK